MTTGINSRGTGSKKANQERLYQIILKPVISEKTTIAADKYRQIVFQVLPDANKDEIKQAVEALFEVKVENVQVTNVRGKIKRFGRTPGKRKNWKKAYVKLQEGHDIDFLGMAGA
jgi:large subunit ribosomal protein L23